MTTTAYVETKKGSNPRWQTGSSLGMLSTPDGYKGRWCDSDEAKISKKLSEGWEFVNKTKFPQANHLKRHNQKDIKDGDSFNGAIQYRELVGMMLPIEDVNGTGQCIKERTAYYQKITDSNLRARVHAEDNKSKLLGGDPTMTTAFKGRLTVIE